MTTRMTEERLSEHLHFMDNVRGAVLDPKGSEMEKIQRIPSTSGWTFRTDDYLDSRFRLDMKVRDRCMAYEDDSGVGMEGDFINIEIGLNTATEAYRIVTEWVMREFAVFALEVYALERRVEYVWEDITDYSLAAWDDLAEEDDLWDEAEATLAKYADEN
jgi:hypothetical protein